MTAVEQLIDQLTSVGVLEIPQGSNAVTYIIEQAKEMEKEQIFDAYITSHISMMSADQYYYETFKQQEDETDSI